MQRVTIVVLNFNYAGFVAEAIDSALAQTWPDCEVVVVDNGSTDHSLQVIAPYEGRVRVVRQPVNIGQGQGYNLGFEAARGDWILWLDADDVLDHDAVATCMALADEHTAKAHFPLRLIDSEGRPLGGVVPYVRHEGDVVPIIRRFGHYAGPPGSGNLYHRTAIAPCFPVPPQDWPIGTDTVPFLAAPFGGKVLDTGRALGCYRLHGKGLTVPGFTGNYSASMAGQVRLDKQARDRTLALLQERSGVQVPGPFLSMPTHLRHRITSWRLGADHPFPEDNATDLLRMMWASLAEWPGYSRTERLLWRGWALAVLLLPRPFALRLLATRGLRRSAMA